MRTALIAPARRRTGRRPRLSSRAASPGAPRRGGEGGEAQRAPIEAHGAERTRRVREDGDHLGSTLARSRGVASWKAQRPTSGRRADRVVFDGSRRCARVVHGGVDARADVDAEVRRHVAKRRAGTGRAGASLDMCSAAPSLRALSTNFSADRLGFFDGSALDTESHDTVQVLFSNSGQTQTRCAAGARPGHDGLAPGHRPGVACEIRGRDISSAKALRRWRAPRNESDRRLRAGRPTSGRG